MDVLTLKCTMIMDWAMPKLLEHGWLLKIPLRLPFSQWLLRPDLLVRTFRWLGKNRISEIYVAGFMSVAICFPICSTQLNLKALLSTFHLDFGNFEILLEIFSNFKKWEGLIHDSTHLCLVFGRRFTLSLWLLPKKSFQISYKYNRKMGIRAKKLPW